MPSSNTCWGIEIGANAIKAIKLEATGEGKCRVVDFAVVQHPKVLSTPDVNASDVIRVSLGQLSSQLDFGKASVALSIPGHSSFARFAKLPPVEPKKVPEIVKFEAMQQIPFPLEQVEWDYQTFVTPDSPDVEVGIFAVTKERINERLQMLADVGITPDYVVLSPIGVYNALAYDLDFNDKTPGTIVVDIGTTSTDLVIATPGRVWVRTFPLGGHQFTEALVNQFQLSYPKAEKLKREAQDTKHARQVFQAMRPVFTDLAQDIQRSIGYFQSLNKDAQLTRVIGVGSTWRLPGLRKYLKQQLGLDVYRVEYFKKINMGVAGIEGAEDSEDGGQQQVAEGAGKGHAFNDASLNLVTAYGLALQGLGLNAVGGNLMPSTVIRRSMWREKTRYFGMAAGIAAAAAGVMFVGPVRNYFAVKGTTKPPVIQQAVQRYTQLKGEADEAKVLSAEGSDLRAANMIVLQDDRGVYNMLVGDVQRMFQAGDDAKASWGAKVQEPGKEPPKMPEGAAFSLDVLSTSYIPPAGGQNTGTEVGRDFAPEPIAAFPCIRVQMQVSTAVPEPQRFVDATVQKWLRENKVRAGVPYEIFFDEKRMSLFQEVKANEPTDGRPLVISDQGGSSGLPASRQDRDARGPLARPGARPSALPGGRPPGVPAPKLMGAGPEAGSASSTSIDGLAPLAPPAGSEVVDTGRAVYVWYMAFKPAAPAEGAEGGGK
ncbi:MAG: type IV pilus assembly protein PilM [Phycisphaerales bacterium]